MGSQDQHKHVGDIPLPRKVVCDSCDPHVTVDVSEDGHVTAAATHQSDCIWAAFVIGESGRSVVELAPTVYRRGGTIIHKAYVIAGPEGD